MIVMSGNWWAPQGVGQAATSGNALCTAGGSLLSPQITLTKLGGTPGDDTLQLKAKLFFAQGIPVIRERRAGPDRGSRQRQRRGVRAERGAPIPAASAARATRGETSGSRRRRARTNNSSTAIDPPACTAIVARALPAQVPAHAPRARGRAAEGEEGEPRHRRPGRSATFVMERHAGGRQRRTLRDQPVACSATGTIALQVGLQINSSNYWQPNCTATRRHPFPTLPGARWRAWRSWRCCCSTAHPAAISGVLVLHAVGLPDHVSLLLLAGAHGPHRPGALLGTTSAPADAGGTARDLASVIAGTTTPRGFPLGRHRGARVRCEFSAMSARTSRRSADHRPCHYWSLSIRGQFCFVYPVLLLQVTRRRHDRRIARLLLASTATMIDSRSGARGARIYFGTDTRRRVPDRRLLATFLAPDGLRVARQSRLVTSHASPFIVAVAGRRTRAVSLPTASRCTRSRPPGCSGRTDARRRRIGTVPASWCSGASCLGPIDLSSMVSVPARRHVAALQGAR